MKARVKATGEIVEVEKTILRGVEYYTKTTGEKTGYLYMECELDFNLDCDYIPDYWTRLEHQAAIAAMQGILSNEIHTKHLLEKNASAKDTKDIIVGASRYIAHALVEKYKKEERK